MIRVRTSPQYLELAFVLLLSIGTTGCLSRVNFWGLPCGHDRDCYKLRCLEGTCQSPPSNIYITSIEGDGTRKPVVPPSSIQLPYHKQLAQQRFRQTWILTGNNLDLLKGVRLVKKDNTSITFDSSHGVTLGPSISKGVLMSRALKLPKTLVAGLFVLYGVLANQTFALAEVYVLQGEKGNSGNSINQELLTYLQSLKKYLKVEAPAKRLLVSGADLQIVNGSGQTSSPNGTGNLIVGYNEIRSGATFSSRKGSHNLVIGSGHAYDSAGGIVAGKDNTITGAYATVLGGQNNTASGNGSAIVGGRSNLAKGEVSTAFGGEKNKSDGEASCVSGGISNTADGSHAVALGGMNNRAAGISSTVCGGGNESPLRGNKALAPLSTIGGGVNNITGSYIKDKEPNPLIGVSSSIFGGQSNQATGPVSNVFGGDRNKATGSQSVISGGFFNTVLGTGGAVFGGDSNLSDGRTSTVCGGDRNKATGTDSTVCGGVLNIASNNNSSIHGGAENQANGHNSTVCGGFKNIASGEDSTASGGFQNVASAYRASTSGGQENVAAGAYSSILGGKSNTTGNAKSPGSPTSGTSSPGFQSSISGGQNNVTTGRASSILGGNNKTATQENQTVSQ